MVTFRNVTIYVIRFDRQITMRTREHSTINNHGIIYKQRKKKLLRLIARTLKIHCKRLKETEIFLEKNFLSLKIIFLNSLSLLLVLSKKSTIAYIK